MFSDNEQVAIIGGGLSGIAMALCLHKLDIPATVYEMRETERGERTSGGGMMIGANSLALLDKWDVYEKMVPRGYPFERVYYKNAQEETIDSFPFGSKERDGYGSLRIYRQQLLDAAYETCREKGINIQFNKKFSHVVEETDNGVTFELTDGTTHTAALLIGADGIHSKIRDYILPGVKPKFLNLMAVTYEAAAAHLRVPKDKDYKLPVQVTTDKGIFILAPQTPDGSLMLAGTQYSTPDRTREEWAALLKDTEGLKQLIRRDIDSYPDIIRSALENINGETFNVWPFYLLPQLERWTSQPHRRVVILGDAAHALPPTTGQGASQAFEDVYTLGLLIVRLRAEPKLRWEEALEFWQKMRQTRIDDLLLLTKQMNNKRLPMNQQALLSGDDIWVNELDKNPGQMDWLYQPKLTEQIDAWVAAALENGV
ncbi:putative kynurenine 3-monooxygenase protein [Phaeoacremonium minimum UCRPA7]|uniref:Putative kynurenine 3-monooxygenase protein n=1 Tax=Phaeoacremonium minimum (strain UCR-PA7) TaxID=1286976 RepID=R8BW50_PHAM7|nr:putative kynurenine 3-monooxygenase protein [Phaeoacremonium minimum UCRPA7]EOO03550.1 putative kynurenine 3-monooxygenase protein [Phaeoacremonium minimum UCRPA7]